MGAEFHRVRIKDGEPISGLADNGQRLRVMPGVYDAQWLSRPKPGSDEFEGALRFLHADERGGHLDVFRSDRIELSLWPDLPAQCPFEIVQLG